MSSCKSNRATARSRESNNRDRPENFNLEEKKVYKKMLALNSYSLTRGMQLPWQKWWYKHASLFNLFRLPIAVS